MTTLGITEVNKSDQWIIDQCSKFVDIVPICPEVAMGLGIPREEVHLFYDESDPKTTKLKFKYSNTDLTEQAIDTYNKYNFDKIDGFILTRKSPSCGLDNVKTIGLERDSNVKMRTGLFAEYVTNNFP